MPLTSDAPAPLSCHEFCLALKAARERRGITLDAIADATKVPASLFADLERNDLRHWPKGLFRRAFFRDYARMIGLPEAEACAAFTRLFPDADASQPSEPAGAALPVGRQALRDRVRLAGAAITAAWRHAAHAVAHMFTSDDDQKGQAGTQPDSHEWVTDARRVGAPRLRVRIKLPR